MPSSTRTKPGWQNAPNLSKLTASQQGGSRGAQLWGTASNGRLFSIFQETPGGGWSSWIPDWAGRGKQFYGGLAAAQQNDGCVELWALDDKLELWTTGQMSPGGDWRVWAGPNWNNSPVGMKRIAAAQQGGARGAQIWGITEDFRLISCFQQTPGGIWSNWQPWPATSDNSQFLKVTAAQQNDGRVWLWALDTKMQVWSTYQTSPGGDWCAWWNWTESTRGPKLQHMAACQQGGSRGAQFWGVAEDYSLVSVYQETPGGKWSDWSTGNWANAPLVYQITAAQQNNGCVQVWAITLDGVLTSISQLTPGGNWGNWS